MKTASKSNINQHTFDNCDAIRVNSKIVKKAWIDGKRMYFVETRHPFKGHLVSSLTVTSLAAVKAAV